MSRPPTDGGFKDGQDPRRNAGGRTPSKWLREYLDAANDKGPDGQTRRQAIAAHLFEVATSWTVKIRGRGEDAIEVADAKDSIEAAKLLMAYDMGKPVEQIEVESPLGTMSHPTAATVDWMNSEQRMHKLRELLGKAMAEPDKKDDASPEETASGPEVPDPT